jgi:hypothetical protein
LILLFIRFNRLDVGAHRPLLGWLIIAATPTTLAIAKSGSNLNYLTEMYACLAIVFGIVVASLESQKIRRGAILLSLLWCSLPSFGLALKMPQSLNSLASAEMQRSALVQFIRKCQGPILTDDLMGLELLAEKQIIFQPYEVNQLARKGLWNDRKLRRLLRTKRFSAALIAQPFSRRFIRMERWSKAQWRILRRGYQSRGSFGQNEIYLPKAALHSQVATLSPILETSCSVAVYL